MKAVNFTEARKHLSRLLDEVERGEEITITRRGQPVARMVPFHDQKTKSPVEIMDALREFRKGNRLEGVTLQELIEEGRRY
jgi:prevent-host-death family protein